jgi:hypothetical protein
MGSATIRRFAFVAAILLLAAPAWCRPGAVADARDRPGRALVGLAPAAAGTVPAIRRHAAGAWFTIGAARADHGRAVAVAGLLGLLSLTRLLPWATVKAVSHVPPSIGRRRHVIALRAPPRPCCA